MAEKKAYAIEGILKLAKEIRPQRDWLCRETNRALWLYYGGDHLKDLIRPFASDEDPDKFAWRQLVTMENYQNLVRQIVRKYLESITRAGKVTRHTGDIKLDEYLNGRYAEWYWREVAPFLLLLPEVFVQAAFPVPTGPIDTEQDEIDNQGSPYCVVHFPHHIRNFSLALDGSIEWISLDKTRYLAVGTDGTLQKKEVVDVYDATHYCTIDKRGKVLIEPQLHGFDQVPFLRYSHEENDALGVTPPIGHSFMFDVIQGSLGHLEYTSMFAEAIHVHVNLKLVTDSKTAEKIKAEGLGNTKLIEQETRPQVTNETYYLETPSMEVQTLERIIWERKADEIFGTARIINPKNVNVQSGVAKAIDAIPQDGVTREVQSIIQGQDLRQVKLLASKSKRVTKDKLEVKYPGPRDAKTIADATTETRGVMDTLTAGDLPRSKTGDRLMSKALYAKALPDASETDQKKIEDEIAAVKDIPDSDTTDDNSTTNDNDSK